MPPRRMCPTTTGKEVRPLGFTSARMRPESNKSHKGSVILFRVLREDGSESVRNLSVLLPNVRLLSHPPFILSIGRSDPAFGLLYINIRDSSRVFFHSFPVTSFIILLSHIHASQDEDRLSPIRPGAGQGSGKYSQSQRDSYEDANSV